MVSFRTKPSFAARRCRGTSVHHTVEYDPFIKSQLASINSRALCGANLVRNPAEFRWAETRVLHRVVRRPVEFQAAGGSVKRWVHCERIVWGLEFGVWGSGVGCGAGRGLCMSRAVRSNPGKYLCPILSMSMHSTNLYQMLFHND